MSLPHNHRALTPGMKADTTRALGVAGAPPMTERADPAYEFELSVVADAMLAHKRPALIAMETGIPLDRVRQLSHDLRGFWKQRALENHEEWVQQELARLDAMERYIWHRVAKGELFAMDRALAIMERRAKLLGLDQPVKVDITHKIRQMAIEAGIDPEEAVREAERMIKGGFTDD